MDISRHELKTKHLNKVKSSLISNADSEENTSTKVYMKGRTGSIVNRRVNTTPSAKWLKALTDNLKNIEDDELEDFVTEALENTVIYLVADNQEEIVDDILEKVESLDEATSWDVKSRLKELKESTVEINFQVTTGVETGYRVAIGKSNEKRFLGKWRNIEEIILPEGDYQFQVTCSNSMKTKEKEIENETTLKFDFANRGALETVKDKAGDVSNKVLQGRNTDYSAVDYEPEQKKHADKKEVSEKKKSKQKIESSEPDGLRQLKRKVAYTVRKIFNLVKFGVKASVFLATVVAVLYVLNISLI